MQALRVTIAVLAVVLSGCTPDQEHDSDAELLRVFGTKRAVFDELLAMIQEDKGLERVDYDWTQPDPPPIPAERLAKYRRMLKEVGCVRGFVNVKAKDQILFLASSTGAVTGGSNKGFSYRFKTPTPIVDDLDKYNPGHTRTYEAFRHIEGNWYLIYEYDD